MKKTAKPLQQFLVNKKNLGRRWFLRNSHKQQKILPPNKQVSHSKNPLTLHNYWLVGILISWLTTRGPALFRFVKPRTHKPSITEIPDTSLLWRLPSDAKLVAPNWGDFFFLAAGDLRQSSGRKWSLFLAKERGGGFFDGKKQAERVWCGSFAAFWKKASVSKKTVTCYFLLEGVNILDKHIFNCS